MSSTVSGKIKNTQSAFPAQTPGATVRCPAAKTSPEAGGAQSTAAPVEVKTDFALTQQILQSMGSRPAPAPTEKAKEKKAWIEILLVDNEGVPMPNVRYRITPPGGAKPVEGRLNEHGQAGVYGIEPGSCKITFPDLDKDAWD